MMEHNPYFCSNVHKIDYGVNTRLMVKNKFYHLLSNNYFGCQRKIAFLRSDQDGKPVGLPAVTPASWPSGRRLSRQQQRRSTNGRQTVGRFLGAGGPGQTEGDASSEAASGSTEIFSDRRRHGGSQG
ncbi:MAG: hypothetical protein LBU12_02510 [Deltaproteobacteria bacterium]|jgi:hypothetical protein|nr:hypothetical protein [Deltaproteobacteria bacterium]